VKIKKGGEKTMEMTLLINKEGKAEVKGRLVKTEYNCPKCRKYCIHETPAHYLLLSVKEEKLCLLFKEGKLHFLEEEITEERINPHPVELYELKLRIEKYFFQILEKLIEKDILKKEEFKNLLPSFEFANLTKLYLVWKRERVYELFYGDLVIYDIPCSFQRKITFANKEELSFFTVKSRFYISKRDGYYILVGRNQQETFYFSFDHQKIVIYRENETPYRSFPVRGYEKYKDILHQPCEIYHQRFKPYLFFNFRLGDVVFVPETWKDEVSHFQSAPPSSLKKICLINGRIENDILRPEENQRILIYHPEHGTLILEPQIYLLKEVPYLRRGHD